MDYRAFVASTFVDLEHHRAQAIEALRKSGISVDPMEDWTADSDEPKKVSTDRMRDCDLCVLLVGARRGHRPEGESLSITQLEYAEAVERGLDVLVFLYDGESAWPPDHYELGEDSELQRWRAELFEHKCVATFTTDAESINEPLRDAVARWIQAQAWPEIKKTYLENLAAAHGSVRFLGIGIHQDANDRAIDEIFVEPRASTNIISTDAPLDDWPETSTLLDLLDEQHQLVLLGDPGSGKSTIVSWVVWNLARPEANPLKDRLGELIPFPLILRELDLAGVRSWQDLLDAGFQHWSLRLLGRKRYASDLEDLLAGGQVLFMLDGLDEISNARQRSGLASAIREGMLQRPRCRWLLTSRLVGFGDIEPVLLDDAEKEGAARKYYVAPFDDAQIQEFAQKWYRTREASAELAKRDAASFVGAIRANPSTHRLARIANLLTMMALIHRQEADLPNGRALLYAKIADAYTQSIDEQRRLESLGYSLLEKTRFLSRIGFEMQRGRGETEGGQEVGKEKKEILASRDEVRGWLRDAVRVSRRRTADGDEEEAIDAFLDEVCRRSGILIPRGEDLFAFSHLSFQEYFAAVQLLQQFKLPARKLARGEGLPGARRHDLAAYVDSVPWRETLVLLVELTAANEPDFTEDLLACLFGEEFERLKPRDRTADSLKSMLDVGVQLATLANNPHSGLREAGLQHGAIMACCDLELAYQRSVPMHGRAPVILRALFQSTGLAREEVWRVFLDALRMDQTSSLELFAAPLVDASPLGLYTGLRALTLDRTGVRDLSMLANMGALRMLSIGSLPGLDLNTMPDLPCLQMLDLTETDALDLTRITHLQGLEALALTGSGTNESVIDLEPLLELTQLKYLLLNRTNVRDLGILATHESLTSITTKDRVAGALRSAKINHEGWSFLTHVAELKAIIDTF